ncbi:response regulator [Pantanalinema sp. GBBB05]|uniref:response regulator n=1 Tax=Pantanalinema sp. GBBB05 TaxID=2604139 RepID=UPI001DE13555|nr:response regulator [Pantanalinema sp. GBBB05]
MSSPSLRILVVDDNADNLTLLQFFLETEGYQVETANSGKLAISKIQTTRPDLVLLDVMMPGMNGYEVTQVIRQDLQLRDLPIVLITADARISKEQTLNVGANDVLSKPIDFNTLLTLLNSWHRISVA